MYLCVLEKMTTLRAWFQNFFKEAKINLEFERPAS